MSRPNARMADLPKAVTFAKWTNYQHPNATHWIKVHFSITYDKRTKGADGALGRLLRGMLLACGGHGEVTVKTWVEHSTDKRSARNEIKKWIDNGLLIPVPVQIDREIERTTTTSEAVASVVVEKPEREARAAAPKPPPKPAPRTWLEPFRLAWEAVCGAGSFSAVAGQMAKFAKPLVDANGADAVAANLARYLADTPGQFRSIAHFAGNYAAYSALRTRSTDDEASAALGLVRRVVTDHKGPLFTPQEAWSVFDPATRAGISAVGGLAAIWDHKHEPTLVRIFTDGYRRGLNGNGTHAH